MNRSHLGFGLALLLQVALIAAMPLRRADDETDGAAIWLKVRAYDRHDVMQGDYLKLHYEIADPQTGALPESVGATAYVILRQDAADLWHVTETATTMPDKLAKGQIAIRGEIVEQGTQVRAYLHEMPDGAWQVDSTAAGGAEDHRPPDSPDRVVAYGWVQRRGIGFSDLESYFVPQTQRKRLAGDIRAHPDEVAAQVRVGSAGAAALLQVRVQDRLYDF